jgi:hypothetical protein
MASSLLEYVLPYNPSDQALGCPRLLTKWLPRGIFRQGA